MEDTKLLKTTDRVDYDVEQFAKHLNHLLDNRIRYLTSLRGQFYFYYICYACINSSNGRTTRNTSSTVTIICISIAFTHCGKQGSNLQRYPTSRKYSTYVYLLSKSWSVSTTGRHLSDTCPPRTTVLYSKSLTSCAVLGAS